MILPSEEKIRLHEIIRNGTEEEAREADKKLDELIKKEMEEEKRNPQPWGNLML